MATKTLWLCGNAGCSHRASKRWHAEMAGRIERTAGPSAVLDFEAAHPDPELMECDDCGLVGSHNPEVEH